MQRQCLDTYILYGWGGKVDQNLVVFDLYKAIDKSSYEFLM